MKAFVGFWIGFIFGIFMLVVLQETFNFSSSDNISTCVGVFVGIGLAFRAHEQGILKVLKEIGIGLLTIFIVLIVGKVGVNIFSFLNTDGIDKIKEHILLIPKEKDISLYLLIGLSLVLSLFKRINNKIKAIILFFWIISFLYYLYSTDSLFSWWAIFYLLIFGVMFLLVLYAYSAPKKVIAETELKKMTNEKQEPIVEPIIKNEPIIPPKPKDSYVKCVNCGSSHKNPTNSLCNNCGKDMNIKYDEIYKKCKSCGADNENTEVNCQICGAKI